MTMPAWWSERRFGLFVHASPASVPGWAPIGADAAQYQRLLGEAPPGTSDPTTPLVEVLAHHRDRWGHVATFDDFVPLLTYERFDAEDWAQLVSDSGANYSILVAKYDDGWTWWDAPGSTRPLTEDGPHRDVMSEYAAACERHGIELGSFYSLVDAGEAESQIIDLVDRHGSAMLCCDGRRLTEDGVAPDTTDLLAGVRRIDVDIVIDDGWGTSADSIDEAAGRVRTFHGQPPDDIVDGPWQLIRGLGASLGYNRAERDEHRLTARGVVALYTEVVAKGGNLLLAVGPDADGIVLPEQAGPIRDAGRWIRAYGPTLAGTRPWTVWGDGDVRYVADDGQVLAIDVAGHGRLAELHSAAWKVRTVELVGDRDAEMTWYQDTDGLHIERHPAGTRPSGPDVAMYRISLDVADRPDELFESPPPSPVPLAPLLADVRPGAIVQLGDGVYEGPASVPPGVVVRGLGPDRTTIAVAGPGALSGESGPAVDLGENARLEHAHVTGNAVPVVVTGNSATVLGCTVKGVVEVRADDVLLRAVTATGLVGTNADRLHVSRCNLAGGRDDVGIDLRRGGGHVIDSNRLSGHLCSIRLNETTGSNVHGNTISAGSWGIHLDHCESAHVHGNRITWTMRAVDVDGGTQAVVDGNAVTDGDSGCVVQDGASECEVYGNHWERCRVGLLAWEAVALHHQDNIASSLHEPDGALVTGP
ncbi:alpha-L-fucosidase [Ilumatobacter nonamiensis]|uniref:alpha-L-fucosidase n=1 Tax=Ilumatobacter nonamiensis TaxID=467093 RepID=UPI00034B5280|nr:alpha-L-fucosidase [Ilumatobacter nonamiensis]